MIPVTGPVKFWTLFEFNDLEKHFKEWIRRRL
jgi:hypothetical protein